MKLVVPVSYFRGVPRSELWLLDCEQKVVHLWCHLADSPRPVRGKGVTGCCSHPQGGLVVCDFNRLLHINEMGAEIAAVQRDDFNDLHSITPVADGFLLTNTGRDSIDRFNLDLDLVERFDGLSTIDWQERFSGVQLTDAYYDSANVEFHRRRLADHYHFNHALQLRDGRVLASSLVEQAYLDCADFCQVSGLMPLPMHDGLLIEDRLWTTSVNGVVYAAELDEQLAFEPVVDVCRLGPWRGWWRGLLATGNRLFVGVTAIREHNSRTEWMKVDPDQTSTGVIEVCLESRQALHFYDLTDADGARVFSMCEFTPC